MRFLQGRESTHSHIPPIAISQTERNEAFALSADSACYHHHMFNLGQPKTFGDWIVHIVLGIIAIFLVWWMLRVYVL